MYNASQTSFCVRSFSAAARTVSKVPLSPPKAAIANTARPKLSVAVNMNFSCGGGNGRDETILRESHARRKRVKLSKRNIKPILIKMVCGGKSFAVKCIITDQLCKTKAQFTSHWSSSSREKRSSVENASLLPHRAAWSIGFVHAYKLLLSGESGEPSEPPYLARRCSFRLETVIPCSRATTDPSFLFWMASCMVVESDAYNAHIYPCYEYEPIPRIIILNV